MEILVILQSGLDAAPRAAVMAVAQPRQMASEAVFLAEVPDASIGHLREMAGVARVLSADAAREALPPLSASEQLFVEAWLSTRGRVKARRGDGQDWDRPPAPSSGGKPGA